MRLEHEAAIPGGCGFQPEDRCWPSQEGAIGRFSKKRVENFLKKIEHELSTSRLWFTAEDVLAPKGIWAKSDGRRRIMRKRVYSIIRSE
jgi:hypothetical protein